MYKIAKSLSAYTELAWLIVRPVADSCNVNFGLLCYYMTRRTRHINDQMVSNDILPISNACEVIIFVVYALVWIRRNSNDIITATEHQ